MAIDTPGSEVNGRNSAPETELVGHGAEIQLLSSRLCAPPAKSHSLAAPDVQFGFSYFLTGQIDYHLGLLQDQRTKDAGMSDVSQGPGWWQASDGKWYSPEQASGGQSASTPQPGFGAPQPGFGAPQPGFGTPQPGFGTPQPGFGTPRAGYGPLAEWGQRVVAYLLDAASILVIIIVGIIISVILGAVSNTLGFLVGLIVYAFAVVAGLYLGYLNGATGQSPGKALTGLKVISEETGQVIGGGMGIVRQIAHFLDSVICYIGWFFPLWDPKKQTIADKVMKTVVVTGAPKKPFGPDIFKG